MLNISVIVCNYNNENYIVQCVDSLINQSFDGEYEIIVIDDCSTDDCRNILEDNYKKNAKVRVEILPENQGLSAARNYGLNIAEGRYICFVDSDDFVDKDYLEKLYRCISAHDEVGLVQCGFKAVSSNGVFVKLEVGSLSIENKLPLYSLFERSITTLVWDKIYIKSIIDDWGIRFLNGVKNEDLDFNAKYISRVKKVVIISDSLISYRQNPTSITRKPNMKLIMDMFTVCQNILNESKVMMEVDHEYSASFTVMYLYFAVVIGLKRIIKTDEGLINKIRMVKQLFIAHKNFSLKNKMAINLKFLSSKALSYKQKLLCIPFVIFSWNNNA